MNTYHLVTNEIGTILGVYGEALLSMAQEQARLLERDHGLPVYVHTILNVRPPRVGESISMRGTIESYQL